MNRSLRMCALLALTSTLTIAGCGDDESAAPSSAASTSGAGGSGGQGGAGGSAGSGGDGGQGASTSSGSVGGGDATGGGGAGGQGGSTSSGSTGGGAVGGGDAAGGGGAGGQGGSTSSASTSSASTSSASTGGGDAAGGGSASSASTGGDAVGGGSASSASTGGGDAAGGGSVSSTSVSAASTGGGDAAGGGGAGGAAECGDLRCDAGETCDSCAADCGVCPPIPPVCGDGVCEPDRENCQACATDCGVCPPAECSRDLCEEGAPLLMGCDPCVTALCAEDPACCMSTWDTHCVAGLTAACGRACGCAHDLCEEGAPLDATCNSCVETVCGEDGDSFCCTIGWDEGCIALSERLCDVTCL